MRKGLNPLIKVSLRPALKPVPRGDVIWSEQSSLNLSIHLPKLNDDKGFMKPTSACPSQPRAGVPGLQDTPAQSRACLPQPAPTGHQLAHTEITRGAGSRRCLPSARCQDFWCL